MKRNQCFNILKVQHFKDPIASLNRDRHSAKAPQPLNTLGKDAADASNTEKKKKKKKKKTSPFFRVGG